MRSDLENIIYSKYPKLFLEKDLPPQETCMCWGLACGEGWFDLIDNLCMQIKKHSERERKTNHLYEDVIVKQVKTKFSMLCFYYSGGDKTISSLKAFATNMSRYICERCGNSKLANKKCNCNTN